MGGDQDGTWKRYHVSEHKKNVQAEGVSYQDKIQGSLVNIHYYPQYTWAVAEDEHGKSLNRGYAYIFALYQHIPDVALYKSAVNSNQ